MAPRAVNHRDGELPLASLVARSAELKRALVDFALSPQCERHLERFMLEAADPWQELSEGEAIGVIDRFALQFLASPAICGAHSTTPQPRSGELVQQYPAANDFMRGTN